MAASPRAKKSSLLINRLKAFLPYFGLLFVLWVVLDVVLSSKSGDLKLSRHSAGDARGSFGHVDLHSLAKDAGRSVVLGGSPPQAASSLESERSSAEAFKPPPNKSDQPGAGLRSALAEKATANDAAEQSSSLPVPLTKPAETRPDAATPAPPQRPPQAEATAAQAETATATSAPAAEAGGAAAAAGEEELSVVFSTDCADMMNWQSNLVYLSADIVGQKGPITRIASGCNEEQEARLRAEVEKLDDGRGRFLVHFTPDYSKDQKTGEHYPYYNKPFGLLHWLVNTKGKVPEDGYVALIDPDFVFMKPLTRKVAGEDILYGDKISEQDLFTEVTEGHPVAQKYLIGTQWVRDFNLSYIAGPNSPALSVTDEQAWKHYVVGPPYILHRRDAFKIATQWSEFVPKVHEEYPHLLGEMFAYSIAAAHHRLPHLVLDNYMTSNPDSWGEGWSFVDSLPFDQLCAADLSGSGHKLPGFLHICQWYKPSPDLVFWKREISKDILSCDAKPMPLAPPTTVSDIAAKFEAGVKDPEHGGARAGGKYHLFQYCQLAFKMNEAQRRFKAAMC